MAIPRRKQLTEEADEFIRSATYKGRQDTDDRDNREAPVRSGEPQIVWINDMPVEVKRRKFQLELHWELWAKLKYLSLKRRLPMHELIIECLEAYTKNIELDRAK